MFHHSCFFVVATVLFSGHVMYFVNGFTCDEFMMLEKQGRRICFNEFGYEFRHEPFGLTMEEAHNECSIIDSIGNLISINEPHENIFLREQLVERNVKSVFLGAVPGDDGRSYQWLDDTGMNFTNWAVNRDLRTHAKNNNSSLHLNPCIEFDVANNGKWGVIGEGGYHTCPLVKTDYVCKFPLIPKTEVLHHFVSSEPLGWREAYDSCALFRMSLSVLQNLKENVALNELLVRSEEIRTIWIAMFKDQHGKYLWIGNNKAVYRKWCPGHPKHGQGACVAFTKNENDDEKGRGCFSVQPCDRKLPFVCEKRSAEYPVLRVGKVAEFVTDNWNCPKCVKDQKERGRRPANKKKHSTKKLKRKSLVKKI